VITKNGFKYSDKDLRRLREMVKQVSVDDVPIELIKKNCRKMEKGK